MLTITSIHTDTCDNCCAVCNGVEFVRHQDPAASAFQCWRHFRMTLEAMRIASILPVNGNGSAQYMVAVDAVAPQLAPSQSVSISPTGITDERSRHAACFQQRFLHGETKGGTDRRDTGGEG